MLAVIVLLLPDTISPKEYLPFVTTGEFLILTKDSLKEFPVHLKENHRHHSFYIEDIFYKNVPFQDNLPAQEKHLISDILIHVLC